MSEQVQTHREIWGRPFPVNGEWDAGVTRCGRITARLTPEHWEVVSHRFPVPPHDEGGEILMGFFPPTEAGERQAKEYALYLLDQEAQP